MWDIGIKCWSNALQKKEREKVEWNVKRMGKVMTEGRGERGKREDATKMEEERG